MIGHNRHNRFHRYLTCPSCGATPGAACHRTNGHGDALKHPHFGRPYSTDRCAAKLCDVVPGHLMPHRWPNGDPLFRPET